MAKIATPAPAKILAGFKALSDPLRIRVVELLRSRELCVCDLCEHLNVGQSKLSFHLKALREAGLLRSRQEGRWIYYSLNPTKFGDLEQYLAIFRGSTPTLPAQPCPSRHP